MKRSALVITLLLIMLFGAYLGYDYFKASGNDYELMNYVPESAGIVFENNRFPESWNTLLESSSWQSLNEIKTVSRFNSWLSKVDTSGKQVGRIDQLTKGGLLISAHKISKNELDFLIYLDLNEGESQKVLTQILDNAIKEDEVTLSTRNYQDFKIEEISWPTKETFSYIIHENTFVGSSTPFLVEDVIRQIQSDFRLGFSNANQSLNKVPKLATDQGNIYLNISHFQGIANTLLNIQQTVWNSFGSNAYFDLTIDTDHVLLSGFTNAAPNNYLSTLSNQLPQKNNFKYYLSNNTGHFIQIGIQDGLRWHSDLLNYWNTSDQKFLEERLAFADSNKFDFERAFTWMGKGLAIARTPQVSGEIDHLIIIDTDDLNDALNHLNVFSESLVVKGDSVYQEKFGELTIKELPIAKFPYYLWGSFFSGFDQTFYAVMDDYLIFSDRIQSIKSLVNDIETENTLGRSVQYNKFQSTTLEESNFKLVINTSQILDVFIDATHADWNALMNDNRAAIGNFRYMGVDFSSLDDNYYSNISINHEYSNVAKTQARDNFAGTSVALNYPLATKPFVVRSHVDNSREVLLQDSLNYIMLISSIGDKLWEKEIDGLIVSNVSQVDYYGNGKLQYFFTTKEQIYIIDRLGNMVEGFPKKVDFSISNASVVDYDKSKRYRYLLSDKRGNLYLFNKQGISLEGWNPKQLTGRLATEPFHLRVRGQDVMIAIQNDGTVNVFNRRGESKSGFPLKIDGRFETNVHIKRGDNLASTILTMVSKNGLLAKFNLVGDLLSTEQLYKPNQESKFFLAVDALGKTYTVVRQDLNRLVLIDSNGREFLAKDYLSEGDLNIQYYNFSTSNQLYVVTDLTQGFSYVYDAEGTLVSSRPIDSQFDVSMMYYESKKMYEIFVSTGNTFRRLSF